MKFRKGAPEKVLEPVWVSSNPPVRHSYLPTYLISYLLNSSLPLWRRILLQKLTGFQLVKKFSAFHGTRRFISVFTSAHHLSLSWASSIQSMPPHPNSCRSILILSSLLCLGLPSRLFPSGFPTKTLYTSLFYHISATCPAHLILLDFITRTILGEEYTSLPPSLCSFSQLPCYLVPLRSIDHVTITLHSRAYINHYPYIWRLMADLG